MKTKQCTNCKKKKSVKEFFKRASSPDGLNLWCRDCDREYRQNRKAQEKKSKTTKTKPTRKKSKPKS